MKSPIGHLLILLVSTAVLAKEGASKAHHHGEKIEDGSQKTQEDKENDGSWRQGGRQIVTNPIQQHQQSAQQGYMQQNQRSHGHARGEIQLDLSAVMEEMGVTEIRGSVEQLQRKVDVISNKLQDIIQYSFNDFNPTLQALYSKVDYLTQAAQTLFAGMQSLNSQMKTQQQVLQQSLSNKCDTRSFEQSFQVLHNSLTRVTEEVKQFKDEQISAMQAIYQGVVQNSETVTALQSGVTATYNTCSACAAPLQAPQGIPSEQLVNEVVNRIVSLVSAAVTQSVQRVIHQDLDLHSNTVMRYSAQGNEEIKSYLLNLSQKMINYRDEYLKRLMEQTKKMNVIKKTVTETTQVMQQAAAGAQDAANQVAASAQRSLGSSSMCGGKTIKGN